MNATLKKIIQGVAAVAPTVANLAAPGSGPLVHGLMRAVTGDGEQVPIEDVAAKIENDPRLLVELQRLATEREIGLAQVQIEKARAETERIKAVNATMQAEGRAEHWPQYSWRPFNGFMLPLAVLAIYVVLPIYGTAVPQIPEMLWIGWLSVLGVATWDRGKKQRIEAGDPKPGIVATTIRAIQGK